MGTRSNIYVETEPGTYIGTYCHYDGYPSHMFPTLEAIDHDLMLAHILIGMTRGGLRTLHYTADKTTYLSDTTSCILTNPHMEDWGPDYIYIKCHDGSVRWRSSGFDTGWHTNFTKEVGDTD